MQKATENQNHKLNCRANIHMKQNLAHPQSQSDVSHHQRFKDNRQMNYRSQLDPGDHVAAIVRPSKPHTLDDDNSSDGTRIYRGGIRPRTYNVTSVSR